MVESYISFVVPKLSTKTVKLALEEHGKLDKTRKITRYNSNHSIAIEKPMLIPTTICLKGSSYEETGLSNNEIKDQLLSELGLEIHSSEIILYNAPRTIASRCDTNPFTKVVRDYLRAMPPDLFRMHHALVPELSWSVQGWKDLLIDKLPTTYSMYPPMLLLPAHVFMALEWWGFLGWMSELQKQDFYRGIAEAMDVTHIAINASIPRVSSQSQQREDEVEDEENILRKPTNLEPLYGDFGPIVTSPNPAYADFTSALWVSAKQNGIIQVWAPIYTMFSRGNITEKARLLTLPSVLEAASEQDDNRNPTGCTAVDLYAGIGYFAFSYAKAGVKKILGFELNPWSVEGFRRGAKENGWGVSIYSERNVEELNPESTTVKDSAMKFLLFQMNNEVATSITNRISAALPPIRHVNCGLLPSSRGSWDTAVRVLDRVMGGWIHIHENMAIKEIEQKAGEVVEEIQKFVDMLEEEGQGVRKGRAKVVMLEHVERVKTFAPGVMHCVLDVRVVPTIIK